MDTFRYPFGIYGKGGSMEGLQTMQYVEMAYARVSTKSQSLERQETSILETVPDLRAQYFFKDKYTGKEFVEVR